MATTTPSYRLLPFESVPQPFFLRPFGAKLVRMEPAASKTTTTLPQPREPRFFWQIDWMIAPFDAHHVPLVGPFVKQLDSQPVRLSFPQAFSYLGLNSFARCFENGILVVGTYRTTYYGDRDLYLGAARIATSHFSMKEAEKGTAFVRLPTLYFLKWAVCTGRQEGQSEGTFAAHVMQACENFAGLYEGL
ncbi:hypothetical protein BDZ85DRAFT_278285 [Elsinoe ampelina]|uniref:Uncharacterized protein n=1 Tax=Elsinoe ampelina TaxID=302913 RepID=A0A6A6GKZ5_9PEZI|nr:hypothetical protein BDZ85DRAFT_278285 [Elsinoe ampelina]